MFTDDVMTAAREIFFVRMPEIRVFIANINLFSPVAMPS